MLRNGKRRISFAVTLVAFMACFVLVLGGGCDDDDKKKKTGTSTTGTTTSTTGTATTDPVEISHMILDQMSNNKEADPRLKDPYYGPSNPNAHPDWTPETDSPVLGSWTDPGDSFFDTVTYVGAMDSTDWTSGWIIHGNETVPGGGSAPTPNWTTTTTLYTDPGGGGGTLTEDQTGNYIRISGEFYSDLDLTNASWSPTAWYIHNAVFIGDDNNSGTDSGSPDTTFTIPAGAVLYGSQSGTAVGVLVIRRDAKIIAVGTSANPIVFTSPEASPNEQDWGGLVINGRAYVNADGSIPSYPEGEGSSGTYGGTNDMWNSGVLKYVVVAYAGYLFTAEDELNGIAFQGVGNGTIVDYVQVHRNSDDGIEFFGGTCNIKHVVTTGIGDDNFDWTYGWTGKAQFLVAQQYDMDGDNGIEADNNGDDPDAPHRSCPTISNFTFVGVPNSSKSDLGILLRRGTGAKLYNGIVMGFNQAGLDIDTQETFEAAYSGGYTAANLTGTLVFDRVYFYNNGPSFTKNFKEDTGEPVGVETFVTDHLDNNGYDNYEVPPLLKDPYYNPDDPDAVPNFCPYTGSPCLSSVSMPSDSFFDTVTYTGAMSTTDWTDGWTVHGDETVPGGGSTPSADWSTATVVYTDPGGGGGTVSEDVTGDYLRISGEFYSDLDLTNASWSPTAWYIHNAVFIGDDNNSGTDSGSPDTTFTIPAGAVLYGSQSGTAVGVLVIRRDAKIIAVGTSANPIVFTSPEAVPAPQDWGGLVINGRAYVNADGSIPSYPEGEGSSGTYGGTNDMWNSGVLKYVVVAYAGYLFTAEDELNGIAFQGVGNGTIVDYVQVHRNSDDGIEFFGGTCNIKHVLTTGIGDDNFDWTYGWTGKAQFLVAQQYDMDGDNGIEADNNGDDPDAPHRSAPTISNFTFVGQPTSSNSDLGMLLRRGTGAKLYNGIVMGFNDAGLDIDTTETFANAYSGGYTAANITGNLLFDSCFFANGASYQNFLEE